MSKAIVIFAANTFFLCALHWEIGESIADGLSLRGAAWDFVTHGPAAIYSGFLLGLLGCIAVWVRVEPLRRWPLAILLVALVAMNWLLEDSLGSERVRQILERFILCSTITLSAVLAVWPLRSRQISISQAGWLTLFVAIGCAAARLQASYGALWGVSSGIMVGVIVGFIAAAEFLLPARMVSTPLVATIAAFPLYAADPDVFLGLVGWLAPMVTCGITVALVSRHLDCKASQSNA